MRGDGESLPSTRSISGSDGVVLTPSLSLEPVRALRAYLRLLSCQSIITLAIAYPTILPEQPYSHTASRTHSALVE